MPSRQQWKSLAKDAIKQASPGLVVRGAVRIVASVASRLHLFHEAELCPSDLTRWRALRIERPSS